MAPKTPAGLRRRASQLANTVMVARTPLFDDDLYRWSMPGVPAGRLSAAAHYVRHGHLAAASNVIDTSRYLRDHPDVALVGASPLVHYLSSGRDESRLVFSPIGGLLAGRDEAEEFLRSGALAAGELARLRAFPWLLHEVGVELAPFYSELLAALARRDEDGLQSLYSPVVAVDDMSVRVEIVGDDPHLVAASLLSIVSTGQTSVAQVSIGPATADWPAWLAVLAGRGGDSLTTVTVIAGAILFPTALAALADRAQSSGTEAWGALFALDGDRRPVDAAAQAFSAIPAVTRASGAVAAPAARALWWPRASPRRDASVWPHALVVDTVMPTPDRDSGSLCTVNYLLSLSALGYRVTFVPFDLELPARYRRELEAQGIEVLGNRHIHSIDEFLQQQRIDLALLVRPWVFATVEPMVRRLSPSAPALYVPVDLHFVRMERQQRIDPHTHPDGSVADMRELELANIRAADATLVLSSAEATTVLHEAPGAVVAHVPMARDAPGPTRTDGPRDDIVFIGGFSHAPNRDAVHWFLDDVWPLIEPRLPTARFVVYGSDLPDELRARQAHRVIMHGWVESVDDAFAQARLAVVPLRYGAGVKGKVVSAMLAGVAIVSTEVGTEGMDLAGGAVVTAVQADAFADAVVELYGDRNRLERLSREGFAEASARFSPQAQRRALESVLDRVGATTRA